MEIDFVTKPLQLEQHGNNYVAGINGEIIYSYKNKEYFVYCLICGIETVETYTSKAKALKAFADGKTKPISGKAAGGGE